MTKDEIIKLANASGGLPYAHRSAPKESAFAFGPQAVEAFARACYEAGRVAEREECARVAEGFEANRNWVPGSLWGTIRKEVAAAIRARGKA